jgi:hypothetical protein
MAQPTTHDRHVQFVQLLELEQNFIIYGDDGNELEVNPR